MKLTENQIEEAVNDQVEKTLKYIYLDSVLTILANLNWPDNCTVNNNDKEDVLDFIESNIRDACRAAIDFEETVVYHDEWLHVVVYYDNDVPMHAPWIRCNVIIGACSYTDEETRLHPVTESEIIENQQKQIEELKGEIEDLRIALHKSGGGGNYAVRTKTY